MKHNDFDVAFAATVQALEEPAFAHIIGIGARVGNQVRLAGRAPLRSTDCFSVTKSVLAWAMIEAVRAGVFRSLDEPVELADGVVTVADLLWMRAGWVDAPGMDVLSVQPGDPLHTIVAALRGRAAAAKYENAGYHLLMRELQQRTGGARSFIGERVLAPAGVHEFEWDEDWTGVPWGHAHLQICVRDLLRLGTQRLHDATDHQLGRSTTAIP